MKIPLGPDFIAQALVEIHIECYPVRTRTVTAKTITIGLCDIRAREARNLSLALFDLSHHVAPALMEKILAEGALEVQCDVIEFTFFSRLPSQAWEGQGRVEPPNEGSCQDSEGQGKADNLPLTSEGAGGSPSPSSPLAGEEDQSEAWSGERSSENLPSQDWEWQGRVDGTPPPLAGEEGESEAWSGEGIEGNSPTLVAVRLGYRSLRTPDPPREMNAVRVMNEDGTTQEASHGTPDTVSDLLDNTLGVREWWDLP